MKVECDECETRCELGLVQDSKERKNKQKYLQSNYIYNYISKRCKKKKKTVQNYGNYLKNKMRMDE